MNRVGDVDAVAARPGNVGDGDAIGWFLRPAHHVGQSAAVNGAVGHADIAQLRNTGQSGNGIGIGLALAECEADHEAAERIHTLRINVAYVCATPDGSLELDRGFSPWTAGEIADDHSVNTAGHLAA